jgi:hypothetical protein
MIYISQCGRKKRREEQAGRRRSKNIEEADKYSIFWKKTQQSNLQFHLTIESQFLVAADNQEKHQSDK